MTPASSQSPSSVIVIRPHCFRPNPQTAGDNAFQDARSSSNPAVIATLARHEFNAAVAKLCDAGIKVHMFDDTKAETPDSVFPNNWFSTHSTGEVVLYPMFAENRRRERRHDVIAFLQQRFRVSEVVDLSGHENEGRFLEGTGTMVFDHIHRIAYAARSQRCDAVLFEQCCERLGFEPRLFSAEDSGGVPVYHTNVLMCVGTDFAMAGLEMIRDRSERSEVGDALGATGRAVIALSEEQIRAFAGNAMELSGDDQPILALSARALASLRTDQIAALERSVSVLPIEIPTIELAGGSVRCMLAGIHLPSSTDARSAK